MTRGTGFRRNPADFRRTTPAGFWSADNALASFCGSHGRYLTACNRQRLRAPGIGGSSWSKLDRLDGATKFVSGVRLRGPNAGPQSVQRIVSDFDGFFVRFEGGHGHHGAKDFFLEDTHLVVAFEGGGLDIESVFVAVGDVATEQHFGTFFLTNREVRFDLFVLFRTGLRTNHGGFVEGVA